MYTFLLDGQTLYYPGDELCTLTGDPVVKLAIGQAGSCEMTIPPTNPEPSPPKPMFPGCSRMV